MEECDSVILDLNEEPLTEHRLETVDLLFGTVDLVVQDELVDLGREATRGDDDDNTTETSHDDPVRDAFMKALGENDDSEGFDDDKEVDEIVWHLR